MTIKTTQVPFADIPNGEIFIDSLNDGRAYIKFSEQKDIEGTYYNAITPENVFGKEVRAFFNLDDLVLMLVTK